MTKDDFINLGFKEPPHFTIQNSLTYNLGRRRFLSIECVNTPNEMLFIYEVDDKNEKEITDLICLHNYDYDGYVTEEKIKGLIGLLEYKKNETC